MQSEDFFDEEKNQGVYASHYDHLITWISQRLAILGYPESSWAGSASSTLSDYEKEMGQNNRASIIEFLSGPGPKSLSVVKEKIASTSAFKLRLYCDSSSPVVRYNDPGICAFMLRQGGGTAGTSNASSIPGAVILSNADVLTRDNIDKEVQYGTVSSGSKTEAQGLSLAGLERVMKGLVEPQVCYGTRQNNELTGQYHRCMATLTDTVHFAGGRTVLYCPTLEGNSEEKDSKDRDRVMDKERLQIMESIVIHWTRQIKEVVNSHDTGGSGSSSKGKGLSGEGGSSGDGSGPLDEIEFWKGRALDLIGIQQQLEAPKVQRIIEVLQYAKSNYIGPFSQLTQQIAVRAAESNDNLKFLESIRTQCTALRQISPEKIVTILPDLLNRIRLIWSFSNYYNDNDHVCGILRKISNEIIRRFKSHILISEILDGDVEFSISRLKDAISCGIEWKVVYHKTVQCISRQKSRYGRSWEIDDASIFAQIDAFVQRCRDLIEICESQMQFVRKSAQTAIKGAAGPVPSFGGTKAQEIVEGINGIQSSFELHMDRLRKLDYDVLDVKVDCQVFLVHWLRDNLLRCVFQ